MAFDAGLLTSLATFFVAAAAPGPATLAVSGTAMARGFSRGVAMSFGLTLGLAAWGLLAGLGFGALVAESAAVLTLLKIVGGLYLLYLAWGTAKSAMRAETPVAGTGGSFRQGLMLNLANPKGVLAWVAALSLGGPETAAAPWAVVIGCAILGLAIYLAYALLFSRAPVMAFYRRQRRKIEAGFAALFAAAGLRLIFWRAPV